MSSEWKGKADVWLLVLGFILGIVVGAVAFNPPAPPVTKPEPLFKKAASPKPAIVPAIEEGEAK